MPEFVLNGRDVAAKQESEFVLGFIEAMFFTESSPAYDSEEWSTAECREAQEAGRADGTIPGDVGYCNIHPDSLSAIRAFCERFRVAAADLLAVAYERDYDAAQAGRDLWYTSQGHGVGFWDRDELDADGLGAKLSNVARYHEANVWFGDHVDHGDAPFVHVEFGRSEFREAA